jgi:predicted lipase
VHEANSLLRGTIASADVFGFVATDPSRSLIVLSFRGTDSIRNWITNLQAELVDTPICGGCKVHDGFNKAWSERRDAVITAINSAKAANPSYAVVVAGHSLGGAVATIAASYLRSIGINCDIYTYGSPRVGNQNFANYVSSTPQGSTSRITHQNDPVPHLPPGGNVAWFTNYYHTSPEYYLAGGSATTDNYAIGDIQTCEGINNGNCAERVWVWNWDVQAHGHYFGRISGCDASFMYE